MIFRWPAIVLTAEGERGTSTAGVYGLSMTAAGYPIVFFGDVFGRRNRKEYFVIATTCTCALS